MIRQGWTNKQFQVGDELVWVVDAKDPKKMMEETRFYRLRKGFVLPAQFGSEDVLRTTVTVNNVSTVNETQKFKKFVNDEAPTTPSLEKAMKELFAGSKYMIDYERNLVVARGTPEQLSVLGDGASWVWNLSGEHFCGAEQVLDHWPRMVKRFVKVYPNDYRRVVETQRRLMAEGMSDEDAVMAAFTENANDLARVGGK